MMVSSIASLLPGTVRRFNDKTPIIYQGEVPRCGYFLKQGMVKVYNLHASGNEQIIRFYGPGDFFPLPWLYQKSHAEFYYHETLGNCEVIAVTRHDITQLIEKQPAIHKHIFNNLILDQSALYLRILSLEQPRAQEKIAYMLYYLGVRYGKPLPDSITYSIELSLTHVTLANLVGLTRETVTMEINKLKTLGAITYSHKIYTIHKPTLETIIGEDNFGNVSLSARGK